MLGALSCRAGDITRAEMLLGESLTLCRQLERADALTADVLDNLSRVYIALDRITEAVVLAGEALEIHRRTVGENSPHFTRCRCHLESLQQRQSPLPTAESLPGTPVAEPVPLPPSPIFAHRSAWYNSQQRDDSAHGFLFLTRMALLWRAAHSGMVRQFPLTRIYALGTANAQAFSLTLDGEVIRHVFFVDTEADAWVQEIFSAILGVCRDPLAEQTAREVEEQSFVLAAR